MPVPNSARLRLDPAGDPDGLDRGLALLARMAEACEELGRSRGGSRVAAAENLLTDACARAMALERRRHDLASEIDERAHGLASQRDAEELRARMAERSALDALLRRLRTGIADLRAALRP